MRVVKPILKSFGMLPFSKFLLFFILLFSESVAQKSVMLSGRVLDEATQKPLSDAFIRIHEIKKTAITNEDGYFSIDALPTGHYHLTVSHLGCANKMIHLDLFKDTQIFISINHHSELLQTVYIKSNKKEMKYQVNKSKIDDLSALNFAEMAAQIQGVQVLRQGTNVAKPMIEGFYGHRVTLVNQGLILNGQQWGADHAPELDANSADKLTLLKGASSLMYLGNSIGNVLVLENEPLSNDRHIHGQWIYNFVSNGNGHQGLMNMASSNAIFSWKVHGGYKKIGDRNTPNYFLTNTGQEEWNGAITIQKDWNLKHRSTMNYSIFSTSLGVLRGSHVGNLTDLKEALTRDVPFFTNNDFSYDIAAPRQEVTHHTWRTEHLWNASPNHQFKAIYGLQYNIRKEFDVRRSNFSNRPSLSIDQVSHMMDLQYIQNNFFKHHLQIGVQSQFIDNYNSANTGINPLLPNYFQFSNGIYGIISASKEKVWQPQIGIRYDANYFNAYSLDPAQNGTKLQHNFSAIASLAYEPKDWFRVQSTISSIMRNPSISEWYSFGLHQGVSGIEEGNPNLKTEWARKMTISVATNVQKKWFFDAQGYSYWIDNFIYLQPQDSFRLTIRGAFPVFQYQQALAIINGFDATIHAKFSDYISSTCSYHFLRGDQLQPNVPLIGMPPNRLQFQTKFLFPDFKFWTNNQLLFKANYVFRQNHLNANQDFMLPPDAYFLSSIEFQTQVLIKKNNLKAIIKVDNVFDATYRDYLNRLRYFANDIGRNVLVSLQWKF